MSDCIVSPNVFNSMVDRLRVFVVPYQHTLETEAGKRYVHLYLEGILSHLPRKNAEEIAALVDVERLVMQDFIGTAPWDHRPLVKVLVGEVGERLGEPDGIIVFDPSSFPKRGTHSVGVKRQWWGHRGKVDNCQVGGYMGYVSRHDHALLDFRLSLPQEWARDEQRRQIEIEMIARCVQTRLERKRTGAEEWLVVPRRPLADASPWGPQASQDACDQDTRYRYRYYLTAMCGSEAEREALLPGELAWVIKAGTCIEASFKRGKGEAGMDEY